MSVVDIKRAYFNAVVLDDEPQCVQLPAEDPEHERCEGKVLKFTYGLQKGGRRMGETLHERLGEDGLSVGSVLALASSCIQRDRYI